jgi:hypothetical protein
MSESELSGSGRALSPRQERIAGRLFRQVGLGSAAFFRDACVLLAEVPPRPTATHLVAHLLREVESSVRSVLEPTDAGAEAEDGNHKASIRAVLKVLGISPQDWVAELWLGLTGKGGLRGLAPQAHRPGLEAPRPLTPEFLDFTDRVEQVLDAVLEQFEVGYFEVFERLDALLATTEPTRDDARLLRQNFPRNHAVTQYFFFRASASWVGSLASVGFFDAPPAAVVDEESGRVQFPAWPESEYLVRAAAKQAQRVSQIAAAIPATDNSRVTYDLTQVAAALPVRFAASLVPGIAAGIGGRFGVLVPQAAGELLVHLSSGGQADEALCLAEALLRHMPVGQDQYPGSDAYGYGIVLREHLPVLVEAVGEPALHLLCKSLAETVRFSAERSSLRPGRDGSPFWRPAIDGSAPRPESDLRDALVDAVRDAAAVLARSRPDGVGAAVAELESHEWLIFRRLALNLLSQRVDAARGLVAERLTDPAVARDIGLGREYLLLARSGASSLDPRHIGKVLSLVDGGPELDTTGTVPSPGTQPPPPDPLDAARIARWQRNRLAAFGKALPPAWEARYQALVAEYGPAPDPAATIPAPFAVRTVDSPVTAGDLTAMPTSTLVEFLRTWKPPTNSGWPVPTSASLRGPLSTAIGNDAASRSADARSFIGLPAVYIGAVINGLWQGGKGTVLDWEAVLQLCEWISCQADSELAHGTPSQPREWREPRTDMLRLLTSGLNPGPALIPPDHGAGVWLVISAACDDPDPVPKREADREGGQAAGFLALAQTVTRAQAVRAAVTYGLWLRRRSPAADLSQVHALLEQHLDPAADPSQAVRSIYGELFPQLAWMDPDWAQRHASVIFSLRDGERELRDAAWDAYLAAAPVNEEAWLLLRPLYDLMADQVNATGGDEASDFRASHMGAHLITGLWNGWAGAECDGTLMRQFYAAVSPGQATELMWLVSSTLRKAEAPDPPLLGRLTAFWEFRLDAVESGAAAGELAEFGQWFATGHFDPDWSLRQLLTALRLAGDIDAERAVISKLAELAPSHTQPCLAVLERLITTITDPWRLDRSREDIGLVLTAAIGTRPAADRTARKIISMLSLDHGIDPRGILRSGGPDAT